MTAFADLVLLDSEATAAQVMGLLSFFLNVLDEAHERVLATLVNGVDPGEQKVESAPSAEPSTAEPDDVV